MRDMVAKNYWNSGNNDVYITRVSYDYGSRMGWSSRSNGKIYVKIKNLIHFIYYTIKIYE